MAGLSSGVRFDRYEIVEFLGSGGMGEVYRASDPKLARMIALKIIRPDRHDDGSATARLVREARAIAALAHPNVLAIYDVGEASSPTSGERLAYIAMELVLGKPLRSYIGDETISISVKQKWLVDIAKGLAAAHDAGIVHRDMKPENVMVRFDGTVKVLDFGVARRIGVSLEAWSSVDGHSVVTLDPRDVGHPAVVTRDGALVGTPLYMAPEQLRGETVGAFTDQFSWGVLAYELLAGRLPWRHDADALVLASEILTKSPTPLPALEPRVGTSVAAAIKRTMEKSPSDRFPSMAEAIAAFEREEENSSDFAARQAAPLETDSGRQRAGKRSLVALVSGALALTAAITVGLRGRVRQDKSNPPGAVAGGSVAASTAERDCSNNLDCYTRHPGSDWHCHTRTHQCMKIPSSHCTAYAEAGNLQSGDVVLVGAIYPQDGVWMADPCESQAVDLARQDFTRALGAEASRSGEFHARPIALVMCDEAFADDAARHLVEDLEVPAVMGFRSETSAIKTIGSVLQPNNVLALVTINQGPNVMNVPGPAGEPRLIWRSTLNKTDMVVAMAKLVDQIARPAGRPLRLANLRSETRASDLTDPFFQAFQFNGRSVLENGSSFKDLVLPRNPDQATEARLIHELSEFSPDVVNIWGGYSVFEHVAVPMERQLHSTSRPIYISISGWPRQVIDFTSAHPGRRRDFYNITNVSSSLPNAELVLHYNMAHPTQPVVRARAPQPSYDGFYLLAYAILVLGDQPITGPAISSSISRLLPPGRKIDVGPADIMTAFSVLRSGGNINLNGAIGSLDFDPSTGEAPIDYAILCIGLDERGNPIEVESGLVYNSKTGEFTGSLNCH